MSGSFDIERDRVEKQLFYCALPILMIPELRVDVDSDGRIFVDGRQDSDSRLPWQQASVFNIFIRAPGIVFPQHILYRFIHQEAVEVASQQKGQLKLQA